MTPARGWFYPGMAIAIAVTVFAGFAPTYYLRPSTAPPLPALTHVHGVVFSAWVVLFAAQVSLAAAGRRDLHKRLGIVGGMLALAMVAIGVVVALAQARRGIAEGHADEALSFLAIPLGSMVSFAALVSSALVYRAHPDTHRRLMLLAAIAILPAAIGRIPGLQGSAAIALYFFAMIAAAPVHDFVTTRRFHPVSLRGGVAVLTYELFRVLCSKTAAWRAIAAWMV